MHSLKEQIELRLNKTGQRNPKRKKKFFQDKSRQHSSSKAPKKTNSGQRSQKSKISSSWKHQAKQGVLISPSYKAKGQQRHPIGTNDSQKSRIEKIRKSRSKIKSSISTIQKRSMFDHDDVEDDSLDQRLQEAQGYHFDGLSQFKNEIIKSSHDRASATAERDGSACSTMFVKTDDASDAYGENEGAGLREPTFQALREYGQIFGNNAGEKGRASDFGFGPELNEHSAYFEAVGPSFLRNCEILSKSYFQKRGEPVKLKELIQEQLRLDGRKVIRFNNSVESIANVENVRQRASSQEAIGPPLDDPKPESYNLSSKTTKDLGVLKISDLKKSISVKKNQNLSKNVWIQNERESNQETDQGRYSTPFQVEEILVSDCTSRNTHTHQDSNFEAPKPGFMEIDYNNYFKKKIRLKDRAVTEQDSGLHGKPKPGSKLTTCDQNDESEEIDPRELEDTFGVQGKPNGGRKPRRSRKTAKYAASSLQQSNPTLEEIPNTKALLEKKLNEMRNPQSYRKEAKNNSHLYESIKKAESNRFPYLEEKIGNFSSPSMRASKMAPVQPVLGHRSINIYKSLKKNKKLGPTDKHQDIEVIGAKSDGYGPESILIGQNNIKLNQAIKINFKKKRLSLPDSKLDKKIAETVQIGSILPKTHRSMNNTGAVKRPRKSSKSSKNSKSKRKAYHKKKKAASKAKGRSKTIDENKSSHSRNSYKKSDELRQQKRFQNIGSHLFIHDKGQQEDSEDIERPNTNAPQAQPLNHYRLENAQNPNLFKAKVLESYKELSNNRLRGSRFLNDKDLNTQTNQSFVPLFTLTLPGGLTNSLPLTKDGAQNGSQENSHAGKYLGLGSDSVRVVKESLKRAQIEEMMNQEDFSKVTVNEILRRSGHITGNQRDSEWFNARSMSLQIDPLEFISSAQSQILEVDEEGQEESENKHFESIDIQNFSKNKYHHQAGRSQPNQGKFNSKSSDYKQSHFRGSYHSKGSRKKPGVDAQNTIDKRTEIWLMKKQIRLQNQREMNLQKSMASCTFHPNTSQDETSIFSASSTRKRIKVPSLERVKVKKVKNSYTENYNYRRKVSRHGKGVYSGPNHVKSRIGRKGSGVPSATGTMTSSIFKDEIWGV